MVEALTPVRSTLLPAGPRERAAEIGTRESPDYRLDEITLDPTNRTIESVDVGSVRTDGSLILTMTGASTINLTVTDEDKALLTGDFLAGWTWGKNADHRDEAAWVRDGRKINLDLDDQAFRLQRLTKTPVRDLEMEFEERTVAQLRLFKGARHAVRAQDGRPGINRAQFIKSLCDEARVPSYIPELNADQPIARAPEVSQQTTKVERKGKAAKGIGGATHITVKGVKASPEQLQNLQDALEECDQLHAPERATLAAICAGTEEGSWSLHAKNPTSTATGPYQILSSTAAALHIRQTDVKAATRRFLTHGFGGDQRGAIKLARQGMSPGEIANICEAGGAGAAFYSAHLAEAKRTLAAFGGATTQGGGVSVVVEKAYKFERQQGEDSWDAMQRLADEVGFRCFVRKGVVWYVSDEVLRRQQPAMEFSEGSRPVEGITFTIDLRARDLVSDMTVMAKVGRWTAQPAMVVQVLATADDPAAGTRADPGEGAADGKWLVESIERPLWDELATVKLTKPIGTKAEPAADTQTVTFGGTLDQSGKVTHASLKGMSPKDIIDKYVLPVGRKHGLKSAQGKALTPANVVAANHAHGATTQDGNLSDHAGPPTQRWAVDMSNGVRTKEERACAEELAQMFGIPWHYPSGGLRNNTAYGFRFQLIHLNYPGHDNHVHFGVHPA